MTTLRIVVPAQLGGLDRRRKEMNFSVGAGSDRDRLRVRRFVQDRKERAGEDGERHLGLGFHFTLPRLLNLQPHAPIPFPARAEGDGASGPPAP